MNTFLETVKPLLVNEDAIVRNVWLDHVSDYGMVPATLTNDLMKFATLHKDMRSKLLIEGEDFQKDEMTLKLLLEWIPEMDEKQIILANNFIRNIPAPILNKYEKQLTPIVEKEFIYFKMDVFSADIQDAANIDHLWGLLDELLHAIIERFNMTAYQYTKIVLDRLIEAGVYDEQEVLESLEVVEEGETFSEYSILAVYACGKMQLRQHLDKLVSLLDRDGEELLQDEVIRTLILFQSDEVVEAVAPFIHDDKQSFEVIEILKNIKTPLAEQTLVSAYKQTKDVALQELLLEAITSHFSEQGFTLIEQFVKKGKQAYVVDIEETFYAFYKAMGKSHPLLNVWRKEINERETFVDEMDWSNTTESAKQVPAQSDKIGRNDPCPCGSGKKYKKCCGA